MIEFDFIVRSVGERTESICIELLRQQKQPNEKITVLREPTHAQAIEKTFSTGIESKADWIIVVDADVLFLPGAVPRIREEMASCEKNVFVVNSAVFDKLYSMKRWAGVHFYRREMLEELYEVFKKIKDKPNLKIETAAIKELQKQNKTSLFSKNIVAIHDFEQFYKDIYRKAYLNTVRNPGNNQRARKNWSKKASSDADYLVMLKAQENALVEGKLLLNSINDFSSEELTERIESLGIIEKLPLLWEDYVSECMTTALEAEINSNKKNSAFYDFYEYSSPTDRIKSFLLKWVPDSFYKSNLFVKNTSIKANKDSTSE